ncbi:MAG: hypothetical protein HYV60_21200, partial [Planctomycetia bacterium]|nr:hypothetical protein [Planctomycetia bacterium]
MDTLKTSVVVVLLLAGLYCVYVVLNKPEQYPQDTAWETGAADPALQIELGTPQTVDAGLGSTSTVSAGASSPTASSSSGSQAYGQSAAPHAGHPSEAEGSVEQNLPSRPSLGEQGPGDRHSLPIPESTTPAASAIAAPELLSPTASPTTTSNEVPALDVSYIPDRSNATPALPSTTADSNALREPENSSNGS